MAKGWASTIRAQYKQLADQLFSQEPAEDPVVADDQKYRELMEVIRRRLSTVESRHEYGVVASSVRLELCEIIREAVEIELVDEAVACRAHS